MSVIEENILNQKEEYCRELYHLCHLTHFFLFAAISVIWILSHLIKGGNIHWYVCGFLHDYILGIVDCYLVVAKGLTHPNDPMSCNIGSVHSKRITHDRQIVDKRSE